MYTAISCLALLPGYLLTLASPVAVGPTVEYTPVKPTDPSSVSSAPWNSSDVSEAVVYPIPSSRLRLSFIHFGRPIPISQLTVLLDGALFEAEPFIIAGHGNDPLDDNKYVFSDEESLYVKINTALIPISMKYTDLVALLKGLSLYVHSPQGAMRELYFDIYFKTASEQKGSGYVEYYGPGEKGGNMTFGGANSITA